MRKFDHIIWDFNGTIVDDAELCLEILNSQMAKRNLPTIDLVTYRNRFDFPLEKFYTEIGLIKSPQDFSQLNQDFQIEYTKNRHVCRVYSGLVDLLTTFITNGGCNSILSAYTTVQLNRMVHKLNLEHFFLYVKGLDRSDADSKINEGIELVKSLSIPAERVVLIGDTTHDYEVAQACNIQCILVASGHQSVDRLRKCGVPIVESHRELLPLIMDES